MPNENKQALATDAYREYAPELRRHASFMLGDKELCEDIVQDTFLRMWTYLTHGGEIHNVRAFLHHVLGNRVIDAYRKNTTTSLEYVVQCGYEPSTDDTKRWADLIDGGAALNLIGQLPRTYRKVLRDRYAHSLSYREISYRTGLSENTIAVQVHRGLAKLKSLLIR